MNKGKKIGPQRNGGYHRNKAWHQDRSNRLGIGAELHDVMDRNSIAFREGTRKLAAWHEECARRRMLAAMTPEERDEYMRKKKS